jgi:hypothetical protein
VLPRRARAELGILDTGMGGDWLWKDDIPEI